MVNGTIRIVDSTIHMRDALLDPPVVGARVHALSMGGVMCQTIWKRDSKEFFAAWHPYLKVPPAVKERMMQRYLPKEQPE